MAEYSGYFNGVEYDEEFVRAVNDIMIKTGVFYDGLEVVAGSGMNVVVPAGAANIKGFLYKNDANLTLSIDTASTANPRKDSIMIRHDIANRTIFAVVVKGTAATNPTAPAPVRNASYYDLKIAEVLIPKSASAVGTITDTRGDDTVCGLINGYDTADIDAILEELNGHIADNSVHIGNNISAMRAGTKVITAKASSYAALFTSAQLNTLFGTSGVNYNMDNTIVVLMNGDASANDHPITSEWRGSTCYVRAGSGNLTVGNLRVNYLVVKF